MSRAYMLVEGHGELRAAANLIHRLQQDLCLPALPWARPIRLPSLHRLEKLHKGCERIRRMEDAGGLLILRDEDDVCPKDQAPDLARAIASWNLPFPTALVLLHREYEVLFLPCLPQMAGRPLRDDYGEERRGLLAGTRFEGDPESIRGVKEWLTRHMPADRSYKPTLDQLAMTRMLDFSTLRASGLPCFGTLERALCFLAEGEPGTVYPPPREAGGKGEDDVP
jgi:hypothetical protein